MTFKVSAALAGFLTLGIEMVAGRMLAPYLGSSLHQWAALIGVVLVSYIVGYGVFERLTRHGPAPVLAVAGAYVLLLPLWGFRCLEWFLNWPLAPAAVASALLTAGLPSILWASLLPYFQLKAGQKKAARILAWGSAGNLLGAWGIAFFAVPILGTRLTWLLLGGLSLGLAVFSLLMARRRFAGALAATIAVAMSGALTWGADAVLPRALGNLDGLEVGSKLLIDRESPYQRIRVWEKEYGGQSYRALALNQTVQFFWNEEEPWVKGAPYSYYNYSALAAALTARGEGVAERGLFLGLGGGLVPWQIRKLFPGSMPRILALELDPGVRAVALSDLPLGKAGPTEVRVGDARQLLRRLNERFDYVLADTFLNSYVPFHLTTREFFESVRDHLAEDGLLVVNLHTVFAWSGLLEKIETTLTSVLPNTVAIDLASGSTLLLATRGSQPLAERIRNAKKNSALSAALSEELGVLAEAVRPPRVGVSFDILTDDLNDTEQRLYETRRELSLSRPF